MARWEPDARQRLVAAALDLFTEQGYDDTTVAQIADRAGLTKSTFFRHFPDKREVLVAGQDTLSRLLAEGIAAAPESATPLEAVGVGPRGRRDGVHAGTARARAQAPGGHRRQRRAARTRRAQARRPGQGDKRRPQAARRARPGRQPRRRTRRPRAEARLRPLDRPRQRPAARRPRPPVTAGAAGGQRRPRLTARSARRSNPFSRTDRDRLYPAPFPSASRAGRARPARAGTGSRCPAWVASKSS